MTTERRPTATREAGWAKGLAHALVRARVAPNRISMLGMLACIIAGAALYATSRTTGVAQRVLWLTAAALIQLRLLANMLDGMVAVESGNASPIGELFNEIPDRISDAAALVGLGYAAHSSPTLGYIATTLAIFTAYVRAQGKAAGANNEFCGPMAKPHRMFIVTLTCLVMAFFPTLVDDPPKLALACIVAGCVITIIRRLVRIAATLRGAAS
jgi:phosphatidylglycerophosphate synthase